LRYLSKGHVTGIPVTLLLLVSASAIFDQATVLGSADPSFLLEYRCDALPFHRSAVAE
jgi:hypothetical protein